MFTLSIILRNLWLVSAPSTPVPNTSFITGHGSHGITSRSIPASHEAHFGAYQLARINLSQTIWSSVFLVFALAWIAVHPNYPSPYDSPWTKFRRRLMLVLWALIFPEMVLYWSVRQWVGARKIRDKFKDKGWTIVDAHFLQMGGFVLAPVHNDHKNAPQGKQRFFTLTVPIMEMLYAQYSKHSAQNSSQSRPTTQTPSSQISPPHSIGNSFSHPEYTTSKGTAPLAEQDLCPKRASGERPPARPIPDIDSFLPPPREIQPLRAPPTFHSPALGADLDPLGLAQPESNILSLIRLASIHMHLPSSPPLLACPQAQPSSPITEAKPTYPTNHIATTFPTDPLLAVIVVLQLVWFLSGCLARIIEGGWRELLLVQVLVLAYIVIYLMIIATWWDKPVMGLAAEPVKVVTMGTIEKAKKKGHEKSKGAKSLELEPLKSWKRDKGKGIDRSGLGNPAHEGFGMQEVDAIPVSLRPALYDYSAMNGGGGTSFSRSGGSSSTQPFPWAPSQSYLDHSSRSNIWPTPNSPHNLRWMKEEGLDNSDARSIASDDVPDGQSETIYSMVWEGLLVQRPFSLFFHFDRIHEFFLKSTGYDDQSLEYELSTEVGASHMVQRPSARIWREGRRHWRRNINDAARLGGHLDPGRVVDQGIAGLVTGNGYPYQERRRTRDHRLHRGRRWGWFNTGEENGVSESVRWRREAGSGGQSRLPSFYAYVTERGYQSIQEMKMKMLVGAFCGLVFGGVHLLGLAFREVPLLPGESPNSSLFSRDSPSFPPQVIYLVCSLILTVSPLIISFACLQLGERSGNDSREAEAVCYWLLEALGWPMTLLYVPARVGVVTIAVLQLIRRFRLGYGAEVDQVLGAAFDGVNPAGAWWLHFLPHFA